jgi:hypothetical protein
MSFRTIDKGSVHGSKNNGRKRQKFAEFFRLKAHGGLRFRAYINALGKKA